MKTETIVMIALVVIIILMVMHNRMMNGPAIVTNVAPAPSPAAVAAGTAAQGINKVLGRPTPFNYMLQLSLGSTGPEVSQLQQWLGMNVSGTFDQATLNALMAALGVSAITLAQFQAQAPVQQVNPAISRTDDFSAQGEAMIGSAFSVNVV